MNLRNFLKDETGAMALDWVVLSAALVGTGIAVVSTVSTGLDDLSGSAVNDLNGSVIRTSFVGNLCEGGIEALQAEENARAANARANGIVTNAIDVREVLATLETTEDDELLNEFSDSQGTTFHPLAEDGTLQGAMACEIARRGLL